MLNSPEKALQTPWTFSQMLEELETGQQIRDAMVVGIDREDGLPVYLDVLKAGGWRGSEGVKLLLVQDRGGKEWIRTALWGASYRRQVNWAVVTASREWEIGGGERGRLLNRQDVTEGRASLLGLGAGLENMPVLVIDQFDSWTRYHPDLLERLNNLVMPGSYQHGLLVGVAEREVNEVEVGMMRGVFGLGGVAEVYGADSGVGREAGLAERELLYFDSGRGDREEWRVLQYPAIG